MIFAFFDLGFGEIFIIVLVILLLFGADKIPEFARTLGKGIRYVKDATDDVKRDIQSSVNEVKSDIDANVKMVKQNLEEANTIKRKVHNQVNDILNQVEEGVDAKQKDVLVDNVDQPIENLSDKNSPLNTKGDTKSST